MTSDTRKYLAEAIANEHEARETHRATNEALSAARERLWAQKTAVEKAEKALHRSREADPDELIAAAREGREPVLRNTNDQRYALASARDELESAERVIADLKARLPDANMRLGVAKSEVKVAASRVLQSSPEWAAFIEDMRRQEKALATAYTVLKQLADAAMYHDVEAELQSRYNGCLRLREASDPELVTAWNHAWSALQTDAAAPLPDPLAPTAETKATKPKRSLFAVK
ncbi:hypothetical protein [Brytella acorum]|uniref:hypothetical protein n=1 Tax=Brytella acorum TaxID=2959299 RepID=UPI0025AE48AF|nr:hypothetical protein [Brytella acorum]MDF3625780.1 hypothetical protein [Brytella acorum]